METKFAVGAGKCKERKRVVVMKKIISPCMCEAYEGKIARAFAKIEFKDGRLSVVGVIGPKSNGDCRGSCGQCIEEIRKGRPSDNWTEEMLQKLCDIWDEWHMNDMRPYCEHQKQLGWDKLASEKVTLYHYRITRDASKQKRKVKEDALAALRDGETFTPSKEQVMFINLPYEVTTHEEKMSGDFAEYYEPRKPFYQGGGGATEEKTLGWLRTEEHPDGILSKPCPVCGYKYGNSWKKEDVPKDVIDWLFSLPDTKVAPAWI